MTIKTTKLSNNKLIKINGSTPTEIQFDKNIQCFNLLLMEKAKVIIKPINTTNKEKTISLEDTNGYLLNDFCRGIELYEKSPFNSLLVISDKHTTLQFLNIK